MAVFDGPSPESGESVPRGSMLAWYGGVDADLREATLAPDARLSRMASSGAFSSS